MERSEVTCHREGSQLDLFQLSATEYQSTIFRPYKEAIFTVRPNIISRDVEIDSNDILIQKSTQRDFTSDVTQYYCVRQLR